LDYLKIAGIAIIAGLFGGIIATTISMYIGIPKITPSENELIREFYLTENAVYVSPHSLRLRMDAGHTNYILVDVRSEEEYRSGHIIGAINIPVYRSPDSSINLDTDVNEAAAIVEKFKALPKDKEIIIYCYSAACMSGRKVGKLLAENGIYVKLLNIGWNEWRYYWNMWNHEGETAKVEDYIASGPEPGTVMKRNSSSCSLGQFGC